MHHFFNANKSDTLTNNVTKIYDIEKKHKTAIMVEIC